MGVCLYHIHNPAEKTNNAQHNFPLPYTHTYAFPSPGSPALPHSRLDSSRPFRWPPARGPSSPPLGRSMACVGIQRTQSQSNGPMCPFGTTGEEIRDGLPPSRFSSLARLGDKEGP